MKPTACSQVGTKGASMMHQRLHAGLKKASRQHWGAPLKPQHKAPRGHQEGTKMAPAGHQDATKGQPRGHKVPA